LAGAAVDHTNLAWPAPYRFAYVCDPTGSLIRYDLEQDSIRTAPLIGCDGVTEHDGGLLVDLGSRWTWYATFEDVQTSTGADRPLTMDAQVGALSSGQGVMYRTQDFAGVIHRQEIATGTVLPYMPWANPHRLVYGLDASVGPVVALVARHAETPTLLGVYDRTDGTVLVKPRPTSASYGLSCESLDP
ncbi:MAG: hypothetical protein KTR31_10315, partial [Myxococcales bacterium]|nr:hypothetical protein [Myxococcales bacterium]